MSSTVCEFITILNKNKEFFKTNEGQNILLLFFKKLDEKILGEKLLNESNLLLNNIEREGSIVLNSNNLYKD